jgi:protein-S-isoprenylcysteine O-methyltransferase Ste14
MEKEDQMLMDKFWKKPPNQVYMLATLMVLLHYLYPFEILILYPFNLIGTPVAVGGLIMAIKAKKVFIQEELPLSPAGDPVKMLTTGLYRISRNPMYLGFVIMLIGILVILGSVTPIIGPLALYLIINSYYIPFEEKKMQESFAEDWKEYTQRVRRWI